MMRRRRLVGALSALGVTAGAGVALWPWESAREQALWGMRFPQPGGGELVMAELRGRPLLLNFWATWCAPCIVEMPLLDGFFSRHRTSGWQVVGLAVDTEPKVQEFLARHPVGFRIGLVGLEGIELARSLGDASGSLPFSAVFDSRGRMTQAKLGAIDAADLDSWSRSTT